LNSLEVFVHRSQLLVLGDSNTKHAKQLTCSWAPFRGTIV